MGTHLFFTNIELINAGIDGCTNLIINGNVDERTLDVRGPGTATNEIVRVRDGAGNNVFRLNEQAETSFFDVDTVEFGNLNDAVRIKVVHDLGGSANMQEWQDDGDIVLAKVAHDGKITGTGLSADGNRINDVTIGALMDDAPNVDQLNRAISGSLPYWEQTFEVTIDTAPSVGTSGVILRQELTFTSLVEAPVARDSRPVFISINAVHLHGSDPGDWDLQLFKNGETLNPIITFAFGWASSSFAQSVTAGPSFLYSGTLAFSSGDFYQIAASGPGVLDLFIIRCNVGWELDEALDLT